MKAAEDFSQCIREKTTLVATMTEYAMMRAKLEEAYQELRKTTKYLNERQEKFLAMMQR